MNSHKAHSILVLGSLHVGLVTPLTVIPFVIFFIITLNKMNKFLINKLDILAEKYGDSKQLKVIKKDFNNTLRCY